MNKRHARVGAAGLVFMFLAIAAAAGAAGSIWIAKANATCRVWNQKAVAVLGSHPTQPSTGAGMFKFMVKAQPLETGELRALRAIRAPRPVGATKALGFVSIDISELNAGIAAYRAGNRTKFLRDVNIWQSDHRAGRAFAAIGAKACE